MMTHDQEDLLLMVARIVLNQCKGLRPMDQEEAETNDEYARECVRLLDELKPYDPTGAEQS